MAADSDDEYEPIEQIEARLAESHAKLNGIETRWRDTQSLLEQQGYMLRPRYRPGWIPSWQQNPSLKPDRCEDYVSLPVRSLGNPVVYNDRHPS